MDKDASTRPLRRARNTAQLAALAAIDATVPRWPPALLDRVHRARVRAIARHAYATVPFYRDVFRDDTQTLSDVPEFRYTTLMDGAEQVAGIMDAAAFLPESVPAHWSVYFGVDDADATLEKIVALGGSIIRPAEDTPYGRLAEAADATGAHFKLVAPNEAMPARTS